MKTARDEVMQQYKRDFYKIYHSQILPILGQYEKLRIQQLSLAVVVAIITAILTLSFYILTIIQVDEELYDITFRVTLIIAGLGIYIVYFIRKEFIKKLKTSCMRNIVQSFENLKWRSNSNVISDIELRNSGIFDKYKSRVSDDSFRGEYKGVSFSICETCLYKDDTDKEIKLLEVIFKGVIIKFDFNKTITSKTFVVSKEICDGIKINMRLYLLLCCIAVLFPPVNVKFLSAGHMLFVILTSVICSLFLTRFSKPLYKKFTKQLKLEDPEFNKHYRAYSTDQVEGRYLITPAFMERFKHIQTAFGAKGAKCAFYDSHILFALSTNKNLFEIGGLFHSLNDPKQMEEFFNELTSIMRLIDRFKLTEHTGL